MKNMSKNKKSLSQPDIQNDEIAALFKYLETKQDESFCALYRSFQSQERNKYLLAHAKNAQGWTLLEYAIVKLRPESIIKKICENSYILLKNKNEKGELPFHLAIKVRNLSAISFLKTKALNGRSSYGVTFRDAENRTSFQLAVIYNLIPLATELAALYGSFKEAIAAINPPSTAKSKKQYFFHEIAPNYKEMTTILLENKSVEINERDNYGYTPLHAVIGAGHVNLDMADLLFSHGANITTFDNEGNTLLHTAVDIGYGEGVIWLLKHNLPIDSVNNANDTPLIHAVKTGRPTMVALLLIKGADVFARDQHHRNALRIATGLAKKYPNYKEYEIITRLLEKVLDIRASEREVRVRQTIMWLLEDKDAISSTNDNDYPVSKLARQFGKLILDNENSLLLDEKVRVARNVDETDDEVSTSSDDETDVEASTSSDDETDDEASTSSDDDDRWHVLYRNKEPEKQESFPKKMTISYLTGSSSLFSSGETRTHSQGTTPLPTNNHSKTALRLKEELVPFLPVEKITPAKSLTGKRQRFFPTDKENYQSQNHHQQDTPLSQDEALFPIDSNITFNCKTD